MPKLSDIKIDSSLFRGRGIRPWNDPNVIKPSHKKTDNKTSGKREQSVSKALAQPLAVCEQSVSKALAKREQVNTNKIESVSKALAQPLAEPLAVCEQSVSKALAIGNKITDAEAIEILVGNEKKLLNFLFQKCQLIGSLESPAITTDELKNILKINSVHLRNLLYRLSNKRIIKISKLKNGRSGWRKFKFSKEIFQHLSLDQSVSKELAKREQIVSKALAQPLAEPLATVPSSSGFNKYLKTTTTSGTESFASIEMFGEWQNLDIDPLSQIGFTMTHLNQIATQNKLLPQAVQDSIYAFSFDLQENNKAKSIKGDPINYFMGILRNGGVYTFPSNYESSQDKSMRLYLESRRKIEQMRTEMEKEAVNLAFGEWFAHLTDNQKKELLPESLRLSTNLEKSKMVEGAAKSHFEVNIWPEKKAEIVQGTNKTNITETTEEVTTEETKI